jgi:hypothetical protein
MVNFAFTGPGRLAWSRGLLSFVLFVSFVVKAVQMWVQRYGFTQLNPASVAPAGRYSHPIQPW